ncbi:MULTISPECIES: 4-oxalocrotonate tautomerase [Cytobacillus]|uniref:Tautomerase n=1 Tax=Cytobacillus stercorigallinarum TaxID=2762240 RepID=A0ABR8QSZ8_9BACI|nr:4-oxalocrotonate tautomerase [Cytobacillus stercorigallinarum]MBD7938672.1 4-oxalocrotonate tautomerase [Cytobacillus stercorigallinarum]
MPIVTIQLIEGREESDIEKLMTAVTETISQSISAPKENIRVIIQETPKTHWSIGGESIQKLRG